MIKNLDEAISHSREVAETQRGYTKALGPKPVTGAAKNYINLCLECAKEHDQLADWLTELQERREKDTDCVEWETTVHGVLAYKVCGGCKAEYLFDLTYGWKLCPKCGAKIKGGAE